jgi:hypothetical protein
MRDRTITEHVCCYCGRPAVHSWPSGLLSCGHEPCEGLSYGRDIGFAHGPAQPRTHRRFHLRAAAH